MNQKALKAIAAAAALAVISSNSAAAALAVSSAEFDPTEYCVISGSFSDGKAVIKWKEFPGAEKYLVYRKVSDGGFKFVKETDKLHYTDKTCEAGEEYSYKVYAVKYGELSAVSEYVKISVLNSMDAEVTIYDIPVDLVSDGTRVSGDYEEEEPEPEPDEEPDADMPTAAGTADDEEIVEADYSEWEDEEYEEDGEYYEDDYGDDETEDGDWDYDYDEDYYEEDDVDYDGDDGWDDGWDYEEEESAETEYYYSGNSDLSAGTLTAGRLRDNNDPEDYTDKLGADFADQVSKYGISPVGRYAVTARNGDIPVRGAKAELLDSRGKTVFTAVTDNHGKAYVFTGMARGTAVRLKVTSPDGSQYTSMLLESLESRDVKVNLSSGKSAAKQLDLMFMIDTTGSMGDELRYLQKEFEDVINRVSEENNGIRIRTSVNFYRDTSDIYTLRSYKFRDRVSTVQDSLAEQWADGGGDYPEAVHTALEDAVSGHEWKDDSVKILFFVLDAPPHNDEDVYSSISKSLNEAAEKGIRIVPIVSSGSDDETEYLMRSSAVITGGTYLFLTDASGVGNPHAEPHASGYETGKLNDMMVNVINEYLE